MSYYKYSYPLDFILLIVSIWILFLNFTLTTTASTITIVKEDTKEEVILSKSTEITQEDIEKFQDINWEQDTKTKERSYTYSQVFGLGSEKVFKEAKIKSLDIKNKTLKIDKGLVFNLEPLLERYPEKLDTYFSNWDKVTIRYVKDSFWKLFITNITKIISKNILRNEREEEIYLFTNERGFSIKDNNTLLYKWKEEYKVYYQYQTIYQLSNKSNISDTSQFANKFLLWKTNYTVFKLVGYIDKNEKSFYTEKVTYGETSWEKNKSIKKIKESLELYKKKWKKDIELVKKYFSKSEKVKVLTIFKKYNVTYNPDLTIGKNISDLEKVIYDGEKKYFKKLREVSN